MTHPEPTFASHGAAEQIAQGVSALAAGNLPLAAGLRVAAQDAPSRQVAAALTQIASRIEQGVSLGDAVHTSGARLPAHVAALLVAAERTGKLGAVLRGWVEQQAAARQQWRAVAAALAYPMIVLAMTVGTFLFLSLVTVPPMRSLVADFGLKVPFQTQVVFWWSQHGPPIILGGCLIPAIGLGLVRLFGGPQGLSRLLSLLPLFGDLWYWGGAAEGYRMLGLLVENQVGLAEALRMAGPGLSNASIGAEYLHLAEQVEQGQPLWAALFANRRLPLSTVPFIRCGEQLGNLAQSLRTAAIMLEDRVKIRSQFLVQALPPVLFVVIGGLIGTVMFALMKPLFSLMRGLTA